jgi:hypothetical protein
MPQKSPAMHPAHQPPFSHHALPTQPVVTAQGSFTKSLTPHKHSEKPAPKEKDVFRETPLRYWGYVNEFGESIKDVLKAQPAVAPYADSVVKHSYSAVGGYVLVDAFAKGLQGVRQAQKEGQGIQAQVFNGTTAGVDAALFQYGASYSIPAFMVAVTRDTLKLGWNQALGNKEKVAEILKHEIQQEIEAKGWFRFDQRLLGRVKKSIYDTALQKIKPISIKLEKKAERRLSLAIPLLGSLAVIPLVVHPIDTAVNWLLEHSYRPLVKKAKTHLSEH